jgi:hypothetical protein
MTRKIESEEAKILAKIASARDKPEWTSEDLAQARPFAEGLAESERKAGRPKTAAGRWTNDPAWR